MNHAGSELEWKLLFYPLLKSSTKSFLFPSVACSSYFWLLCSVFKVRSESFRTHRDPLSKTSINLEGGDTGKGFGGPKWTRTTDLTIISRAL